MIKIRKFSESKDNYTDQKEFAEADFKSYIEWFTSLNIKKRKPSDMNKVDHSVVLSIQNQVENWTSSTLPEHLRVQEKKFVIAVLGSLRPLSIQEMETYYGDQVDNKPEVIKTRYATYYKKSSFAYSSFLSYIDRLEDLFSNLESPHKDVLDNLHIQFKDSKDMKAIATYKTDKDRLLINPKKVSSLKNVYGSLEYVVLHELGHRYLRFNRQPFNIDDNKWITTKYSTVESMSGEEKFAELFALSYYKDDYREYEEIIDEFLNTIK